MDVGDYQIIGHGMTSGPEEHYDDYQAQLSIVDELFLKATKPIIFLTHNVVHDTKLDEIKDKESPRFGQHFGSTLARKMIKKHQPIISIGGHMHENPGTTKIGNTICLNAGFGKDANVFIDLEKMDIEFYK